MNFYREFGLRYIYFSFILFYLVECFGW